MPSPTPIPSQKPKKKGKFALVFLIILVIALVAAITVSVVVIASNSDIGVSDGGDDDDNDDDDDDDDVYVTTSSVETSTPDSTETGDAEATDTTATDSTTPSHTDNSFGYWYEDIRDETIDTPTLTGYRAYDDKLADYKGLLTNSYEDAYKRLYGDETYTHIYELICMYRESGTFTYGLYDMDENGIPEMIVRFNDSIVDVYSYMEGTAYRLSTSKSIRNEIDVLSGGRILECGSDGADVAFYALKMINSNGTSLGSVEQYIFDDFSYSEYPGYTLVSSAEFHRRLNMLRDQSIEDSIIWQFA